MHYWLILKFTSTLKTQTALSSNGLGQQNTNLQIGIRVPVELLIRMVFYDVYCGYDFVVAAFFAA